MTEIKTEAGRVGIIEQARASLLHIECFYVESEDDRKRIQAIVAALSLQDELVEALEPFASERTIDEIMHQPEPSEWAEASVERRIEMIGERKAANTANVLRARSLLTRIKSERDRA